MRITRIFIGNRPEKPSILQNENTPEIIINQYYNIGEPISALNSHEFHRSCRLMCDYLIAFRQAIIIRLYPMINKNNDTH